MKIRLLSAVCFVSLKDAANDDEIANRVFLGYTSIVAGQILFAAGIPVSAVGKGRSNSAIRDYCQQQYSTMPPARHFRLNLYSNRVGIAYVF